MTWHIEYYNSTVEQAVLRLPARLLARYLRLTDLMNEFGPNLGMPHTRAMGEGLFLAACQRAGRDCQSALLHRRAQTHCHAPCLYQEIPEDPQTRTGHCQEAITRGNTE